MATIDPSRCDEFANLLRQTSTQIITYLQALLLDWNDAEDVFQDSCLVLWEKFDEFERGTNFLGWAIRIAQHKAMHFQRSRARRARLLWKPELQKSLMTVVCNRDTAAVNDSLAALARCMERLAEQDRRLVQRCYGDCVPVPQIAADLGRLPESIYNSLRRIRSQLMACIKQVREDDR
jgi:RNA polymerase sigma-70 factor (ECF subfamily)